MVPFIKVERRPGNIPAGDLLERLLVIANLAAPAKPQTPAALSAPRMPTARPPALDFLSSGKAIRLETTTKRLMVIPPFGLRVIRQMLQPRPYSGGIRQPPVRLSFPGANFYRHSLQLINDAESRLVGQIIADKNRFAAANGASCMNAVIASPLLTPRGLISTTHLPSCNASSG